MNATLPPAVSARPPRPGMVWGIAVSLVLHALLIFGYRLTPQAPVEPPPKATMTVWLVPPPKPPAPVVVKLAPPPVKPVQPRERDKRLETRVETARADKPAPADSTAVAPSQAITLPAPAGHQPDPLYPDQQPQAKKFDMNAALKTARKVV